MPSGTMKNIADICSMLICEARATVPNDAEMNWTASNYIKG